MPLSNPVSTLHLNLLGPPRVVRGEEQITSFRTSKGQALLFFLAATGSVQRRSTLAALFWPEAGQEQANASLRSALSDLRKLLGEYLTITRHSVHLQREAVVLDVAKFDALLKRTGDPQTNVLQMQAAVSLYGGDFLEGFDVPSAPDFEQWATIERERLREAMLNTLLALAVWHADQQDYAASLEYLTQLLAIEPTNEAGHRQKMVVLAQMGQRSTALQQYAACQRALMEELGVDPSPETMAVHELILSGALSGQPTVRPARLAFAHPQPAADSNQPRIDWSDAPLPSAFFGRQKDLAQLNRWLTTEEAGLVAIAGMGGVGKTTVAVETIERLAPGSYDLVLWRSLVNAPPLPAVVDAWLRAMAGHGLDRLPESMDEKLAVLFAELQRQRCLLVLDNLESIMQSGANTGRFHPNYKDYGHLIDRMGRSRHRSCLLLTTRELPKGLRRLEEDYQRVRIMALEGLGDAAGSELLRQRGLDAPVSWLQSLVERYSGNPLALKLAADTVRDLYGNNVPAFLSSGTPVFDDIRSVLDEQFDRLSELEREIVVWLAIEREPAPVEVLQGDLARPTSVRDLTETIRSLRRNALVETLVDAWPGGAGDSRRLGLQNVVMEYVTDRLVHTLSTEIESGVLDWMHRYALVKAHSQEYVQESQRRLLLDPVAGWLVDRRGQPGAVRRLRDVLKALHAEAARVPSYAAANLLHFLQYLQADLSGLDFSELAIWQADLRTATLPDVDLRGADLSGSTFADTFGAVASVNVSPDGQHLATGGSDGQVFIWQMADYQPVRVLPGHTQGISCVAWSPDGSRLASSGYDGQVRVWDVRTGLLLDASQVYPETIAAVAWSPDGDAVASAGAGKSIVVRDVQHGTTCCHLPQRAWINDLAFSPDGQMLACGNDAKEVNLWNWRTGELLHTLHGHEDKVRVVAFSPDGAVLASGGEDGAIWLWRLANPEDCRLLAGHAGWIMSLAWSPDGKRLASASADRTIRIWNVATRQIEHTLLGHASWVTAVDYSPDGATLVSGGYDQSVRLWDAHSGHLAHQLHGTLRWVDAVKFSPDGRLLASSGLDSPVRLWEVESGRLRHSLRGHRGAMRAIVFGQKSGLIAGGCDDHQAYLWDGNSGELKHVLRGHNGMVRCIAFSPDDGAVVTGSHDQTLRVWSTATGQLLRIIPEAKAISQFSMAFSADGQLLIHISRGHAVNLIHAPSWHVLERLSPGPEDPLVVAHSTTDHLLACGTQEGGVWVWDVSAVPSGGAATLRLQVHPAQQAVMRLLFSPDGRWLAVYAEDDAVHMLDIAQGRVAPASGVAGGPAVLCLAFNGTGDTLITGDSTRNVVARDAATGEVSGMLRGHVGEITSIDASSTGDLIASSSADGTVRLWDLRAGECVAILEPEGPYAGMNIAGVTGITTAQRATLMALGAVER